MSACVTKEITKPRVCHKAVIKLDQEAQKNVIAYYFIVHLPIHSYFDMNSFKEIRISPGGIKMVLFCRRKKLNDFLCQIS